jgi:hypothetical protein
MDKLLSGRRVLVVEDEMLLLIMIEDTLTDLDDLRAGRSTAGGPARQLAPRPEGRRLLAVQALGFSSAAANVLAYQAKLLEMAQANMQFAFEFAQRLATIRSPVEFPGVIAEFTNRRIAMFQKHSKEMAEFSALR